MEDPDFSSFDKKTKSTDSEYSTKSITFRNVSRLYSDCIPVAVQEFWIFGKGWIKNEAKGDVAEQIRAALELGATKLQLHLRRKEINQSIYADYHARELTE